MSIVLEHNYMFTYLYEVSKDFFQLQEAHYGSLGAIKYDSNNFCTLRFSTNTSECVSRSMPEEYLKFFNDGLESQQYKRTSKIVNLPKDVVYSNKWSNFSYNRDLNVVREAYVTPQNSISSSDSGELQNEAQKTVIVV